MLVRALCIAGGFCGFRLKLLLAPIAKCALTEVHAMHSMEAHFVVRSGYYSCPQIEPTSVFGSVCNNIKNYNFGVYIFFSKGDFYNPDVWCTRSGLHHA